MRRLLLAVMAPVAMLVAATGPVFAHAHLRSSQPETGGIVTPAPVEVSISFSEALEPRFSTVEVTNAAGARVDDANLHVVGGDAKNVAIGLKPLSPGVYTVVWHATSVDTHKTEGRFTFTVAP